MSTEKRQLTDHIVSRDQAVQLKSLYFLWDITRRKVAPYDPALWVWAISLRRLDV